MFIPDIIYYEKDVEEYNLGKLLFAQYEKVPKVIIENHNNIKELREKENSEFTKLKKHLIIGTRKTHKYVENHKVSDYLVSFTSSGCTAMCLYCYLVCNYNKCSYLRIFVNREEMMERLIIFSKKSEKECTFEIGSNSDLILENTITNNLEWVIPEFGEKGRGYITFPTKFDMVDSLLNLKHNGKTIIRMSVNPQEIIQKVEFGTANLENRISAIDKLYEAGYKVGILIAPVIMVENWKELYENLVKKLSTSLKEEVKKELFFEVIFMTYSFVHTKINEEAFPNAINLYDKNSMTGRGRGKYMYRNELRQDGEFFFREVLQKYFPKNRIVYIV